METPPLSVPPATPYRPNAVLRWLYRRFFSHIRVDERWSGAVRDAADRGVVVYVMRSISVLDFLCLDFLAKQFALPLVRFVNDLGLWILEPFGRGERRVRLRRQVPEEKALHATVRARHSALLFLRRRPRLGKASRKGEQLEVDLLRSLVQTQRKLEWPVLLVPQTFVWSKLPPNKKGSILDLFFGPSEWPGKIRVLFQFLLNYRNALLRSGDPFDLQTFVGEHEDLTDGEVADKLRYALLRIIERERTLVQGPGKKTPGRIREELLRSPRVSRHLEAQARSKKQNMGKVRSQARKELRRLCADQDPYMLRLLHGILDRLWNRIYEGMEVDASGLEGVRQAARKGAVVLLPSHKSHVDYLILSDVLYTHDLSPPIIAAGDNLRFWPLGPILRRGGAFFIRRSFKGRKLYAALVDAYVRKLLLEGFNIEFFLEGGRSRTGKLLPPKLGLLSMVVDACLMLPSKQVHFVPVSIAYERIVEERSYLREAAGAEKRKEDIRGLLNTPRILKSKYGRIYVQFAAPLSFDALRNELIESRDPNRAGSDNIALTPPERRGLVQRIAHNVVYQINQVTVVTPAALVASVLLSHRKRGMQRSEVIEVARDLVDSLKRHGARFGHTLLGEDGTLRIEAVDAALELFLDGKLLTQHGESEEAIYTLPEDRRIALEYFKNTIVHFFVPSALISISLLEGDGEPLVTHALRERVRQLSRVFKYEFMYRADTSFEEIFDEALSHMLAAEEVERFADQIRPAEGPRGNRVELYASMLRTYLESYRVAVRGAGLLNEAAMGKKDWLKRTLALGQRMYLAGDLELKESLSRHRLENAMASLRDHGVLAFGDKDTVRLAKGLPEDSLRELEKKLV